jgi:hypothetical protein
VSHHNDVVRQSFTVQAAAYAAQPWISDAERVARLVATAAPKTEDPSGTRINTGPKTAA